MDDADAKTRLAALWVAMVLVIAGAGGMAAHEIAARAGSRPPSPRQQPTATPVLALAVDPDLKNPAPPANANLDAIILKPDESPAIGAEAFLAMPDDPEIAARKRELQALVQAGQRVPAVKWPKESSVDVYADKWPDEAKVADGNGRVSFAGVKEPWVLVVRHPAGFAEVSSDEFKGSNTQVALKPWGKVEGVLRVGATPKPNEKVNFFRSGHASDWVAAKIRYQVDTTTDADGKFAFDNVAPGESWLSWETRGPRPRATKYTLADVLPGTTTTANVGGAGRAVVGRLSTVPSNFPDEKLIWAERNDQSISAHYSNTLGTRVDTPPNWNQLSAEQRTQWTRAWERSPAAREYRRNRWAQDFDMNVRPDGRFRIDDLEPGEYTAQFRILLSENGFGEDLVSCTKTFTVPPLPAGVTRTDEPLDLGLIPVELVPRIRVGQPAPDFQATTLDGKPLKLSDFKGKYVMLKWWWQWCDLDVEVPAIVKAHQAMQKQPDWVLITIGFDDDVKTTIARVNDRKIPGVHCHVAGRLKFPKAYLGSPSTLCVIGPDGKVLARNLHAVDADTEIAKIVLAK